MMSDSIRDRILDATVEQLRRHGPGKTGVVDVARALDMSHSNVYKHFASKSALFDAVAKRWLAQVMAPLTKITADKKTGAPKRLKARAMVSRRSISARIRAEVSSRVRSKSGRRSR